MADALPQAQFNRVAAWIKNSNYNKVVAFKDSIDIQMTRLAQTADAAAFVVTNPHAGNEGQMDFGSIIDWMAKVATTDSTCLVQIIALQATCVDRLAV